jgi:hypothetical protein
MVSMITNLNLETRCFSHHLNVVRFESQGILKAFSSLREIFPLLVDGTTSMPTKHAFHLAFKKGQLTTLQSLRLLSHS